MLYRKFTVCAVLFIASLASVLVIGQRDRRAGSTNSDQQLSIHPPIETVRLNPPGDAGAEIECSTLGWVDFTYQIFNRGQVPITGLKIGTKCACEEVGNPPDNIPPGESASISFRLRAPPWGKMERKIPLLIDGASAPLVLLDAVLRVKFEPPALILPPDSLSLTFVEGSTSARELVLEAIEAKREKRWISGLDLDPSDGIEVQAVVVEELLEADPSLTRRRYRFLTVNRSLPVGRRMAMATVRTSDDFPPAQDSITVWIEVADPVAIVPNPLVIRYSPGAAPPPSRVCVVNRTGARAIAGAVEYDHDLLQVAAVGKQTGSTAAFDVVTLKPPEPDLETRLVFDIGDSNTRELAIRFEPSERP